MFNNKYRIVRDKYSGFEAQVKFWWMPLFWFQCFGINTNPSIEAAEALCKKHQAKVVKYL